MSKENIELVKRARDNGYNLICNNGAIVLIPANKTLHPAPPFSTFSDVENYLDWIFEEEIFDED